MTISQPTYLQKCVRKRNSDTLCWMGELVDTGKRMRHPLISAAIRASKALKEVYVYLFR